MTKYASLREDDVYSLVMFALYKMRDNPQFLPMSELIYAMDKENFLRLVETFGGATIRIPTIDEVETTILALLIFQRVDLNGEKYTKVIEDITKKTDDIEAVTECYFDLRDVLRGYEFVRRSRE